MNADEGKTSICLPGDIVYEVRGDQVYGFIIRETRIIDRDKNYVCKWLPVEKGTLSCRELESDRIGKDVFLTKEEAEKKRNSLKKQRLTLKDLFNNSFFDVCANIRVYRSNPNMSRTPDSLLYEGSASGIPADMEEMLILYMSMEEKFIVIEV